MVDLSTTITEATADNVADLSPIPGGLQAFTRGPATVKALVARAGAVQQHYDHFNTMLAKAEIELGTRVEKRRAEIEDLRDTVPPNQLRQAIDKALSKIRREIVAETDEARWAPLRHIAQAEAEIIATESMFGSPVALLTREGIGTEERSRYGEQIAHSGPAEIRNLAALAVANRDRVLGAAILARLDAMKAVDRKTANVSRQELAEALVGDDYKNARAAIQRIKNRTREALAANRGFMTGKGMNLHDKIGLALNREGERA